MYIVPHYSELSLSLSSETSPMWKDSSYLNIFDSPSIFIVNQIKKSEKT